jgi:hypothetical protein
MQTHGYTHLELGWEATGLLWLPPLTTYLAQSERLRAFTPRFSRASPSNPTRPMPAMPSPLHV